MPYDLSQYLVIGVSSRALFDLHTENALYERDGLPAYTRHQIAHENDALEPGVAFPLVKAILHLNTIVPGKRRAEVVIMSRNSAETSLRIFTSLHHHGLDITRAALSGGAPLAPYLKAYSVDLFLSANTSDVQLAIDAGVPAATVYPRVADYSCALDEIRIAFDGDAVLFSAESEHIYQTRGLEAFLAHEAANAARPLPEGPFAKLLRTLSVLQNDMPGSPIRTALVTSRNAPAHERAIRTLRAWNVRIDEAHFLGGAPKAEVLRAFGAHIFFDDQDDHLGPASQRVPSAQVPYPSPALQLLVPSQDPLESVPAESGRAYRETTMKPTLSRRVSGKKLARDWKVTVRHSLYHKDGTWYNNLQRFPGALFDANGYVVFRTDDDYRRCRQLSIGEETNVRDGISAIDGYVRMRPKPA